MFSRNFMKVFPVRKYGNITAKTGSISTDHWILNDGEIRAARPIVYMVVSALLLLAFDNFHTADEIIGHAPRPTAYTTYQWSVPNEVLIPNLAIIEGFHAINKMKILEKSLTYEK